MPEGDTVHLAGKRLHEALSGRRLLRGELRHPRLSTIDLAGRTIIEVRSVGKHLLMRFDDATTLRTHFRMDGAWHLYRPGSRWRRPEHQIRAILQVPERFAVGYALHDMAVVPTAEEDGLVGHLGPDLLDPDWGPAHEAAAALRLVADPERELGEALLDQRVMAGVGNLYQNEICFLLGRSPWATVSAVDPAETVRLARELLLRNADRPEQSTTGGLGPGRRHWVFERTRQRCRRCGTVIETAEQGTGVARRICYFCRTCQPGPYPVSASATPPGRR